MQTFLPSRNFQKSAQILDWRRLGKQRVEAFQILKIITGEDKTSRWRYHPAVKMWVGYHDALILYYNCMLLEWDLRGYNNDILEVIYPKVKAKMPPWLGLKKLHSSHRAKLLGKNYEHYSKFNWIEKPLDKTVSYYWPV